MHSICICSDIEIWVSDRLPEVKTIEKLKSPALNVVAYEKFRLSDLTGRNLVLIFWKNGRTCRFDCIRLYIT